MATSQFVPPPSVNGPASDLGLRIDLTMDVSPRVVSVVRRFVEESMERVIEDPDAVARVAMAAHELLENAAKYSVDRTANLRVACDPHGVSKRLTVSLRNRALPEHLERLRSGFAEMEQNEDPLVLYYELMRRDSKRKDVSGLGLARIWAEGEMNLALEINGDSVVIMASSMIPHRSVK